MSASSETRRFLLLQGPHGPFFFELAKMLRKAGAEVWRVGFNAGDGAFWFKSTGYIPFNDPYDQWAETFDRIVAEKGITDIVLYGDTRDIHATAVARAKALGICCHVFEEGYIRPYWVTYERSGTNGNSRLMNMSVDQMRGVLGSTDIELPTPPAHWGDMRQHVFYGALYHWFLMFRNKGYSNFVPHRELPVTTEAWLYTKRLLTMPISAAKRRIATRRIRRGGLPYHLVLLQLEHDSSFQTHSPFSRMEEFLDVVFAGFADGAPKHHLLVLKAHPLENGRSPLQDITNRLATKYGITGRVHFVHGGKLAKLLDDARTAVTVNSTASQQVLWRGIPLKVFGSAVFAKPEFVSMQSVPDFFALPSRPDRHAYRDYRCFLMETSQVPGGFYSARARRQLLRQVVDMMYSPLDPYDALAAGHHPPRQPLRIVK